MPPTIEDQSADDDAAAKRALRLLPDSDDLTLLILKGHLMVEEELNIFLSTYPFRTEALEHARLTFLQKLWIIKAFAPFLARESIWTRAETLNQLRNKIAHQPEVEDLDAQIDRFITLLPDSLKDLVPESAPRPVRLRAALAYTAGTLSDIPGLIRSTREEIAKAQKKSSRDVSEC